jgi:predicted RNase H-like nuclease (RuvC/YqgF family)
VNPVNNLGKVFEERNHYKALYEHERDVSTAEIKRLETENERLFGYIDTVESQQKEIERLKERTEKLDKIANTWIGIEENGTPEDASNFYTMVQDILSEPSHGYRPTD